MLTITSPSIYVCLLFLLISTRLTYAQGLIAGVADNKTLSVRHYQVQKRYEYGARLLTLALSKQDQPFLIDAPETQTMNEARGELEVLTGRVDVQWVSTTTKREATMIPIKIPIYEVC
jgi:hypothetical protein